MPRTLQTNINAAVDDTITSPVYLVAIGWSTPVYISSGQEVTYQTNTYIAGNCRVEDIDAEPTVYLPNTTGAYSSLVFLEGTTDVDVTIYLTYFPPAGQTEVMTRFSGEINNADPIDGKEVGLRLTRFEANRRQAPRIVIGPPVWNHVRPAEDENGSVS